MLLLMILKVSFDRTVVKVVYGSKPTVSAFFFKLAVEIETPYRDKLQIFQQMELNTGTWHILKHQERTCIFVSIL